MWITCGVDVEDHEPITGYYCQCFLGSRTVDSCTHVANVIWFLDYAWHQLNIKYLSNALLECIQDAGNRNDIHDENDKLIDLV